MTDEIRTLKPLLRTRWLRPMADEQRRLARLKRCVTDLHVLLAHTRGRFHLADHDLHARIAERVARDYTRGEHVATEAT